MNILAGLRNNKTKIIYICLFILAYIILIYFLKPVYFINDDWIIRDILSGRYSGIRDAHVYQVIYPFAYVFVILYSFIPNIDWWGWYLHISLIVCLYLILRRILSLSKLEGRNKSGSIFIAIMIYFVVSLMPTFIFTFTTTGTTLATTGVFLLLTDENNRLNVRSAAVPAVLLMLAFCTRRDTFLMAAPFLGVWLLPALMDKDRGRIREGLIFIGSILIIAGLLLTAHRAAFSSDEWKDFLQFRSLRIAVHDYTGYPDYDSNKDFYDELGLSREEYDIVKPGQVNTALDITPDIRTVLKSVKEYCAANEQHKTNVSGIIKGAMEYVGSIADTHPGMLAAILILTALSFTAVLANKLHRELIMLLAAIVLLICELTYLSIRGRYTIIVGNALMLMGTWLVFGIYLKCAGDSADNKTETTSILFITTVIAMMIFSASSIYDVVTLSREKTEYDASRRQIDEYCVTHTTDHYFEPAISIVQDVYTLSDMDSRFNNLIVLGGWNYSSPEYEETMHAFGLNDCSEVEKAIVSGGQYHIVSNSILIENILRYFEWKYSGKCRWEITDHIVNDIDVYSFRLEQ